MRSVPIAVLFFIVLGSGAPSVLAQGIEWRTNLDKAAKEAEIYDKPMLVYLSTSWCGFCRKMEDQTFSNKAIQAQISERFVPVSLDGEKYRKLSKKAGVRGFPTSLVMNAKQEVLTKFVGYRNVQQMSGDLASIDSSGERLSIFGKACPVNPINHGKFALGEKEWTTMHRGYRVYFASEENLKAFQDDPGKFWPALDGHCVVSAIDDDEQRVGKLQFASKYEGEIWFFASRAQKEKFVDAADEYTKRLLSRVAASSSVPDAAN